MKVKCSAVLFSLLLLLLPQAAQASCQMKEPQGAVILAVEGQISNCNHGMGVHFDIAMLEALPKTEVKTQNPWEVGEVTYEGVLLRDLAQAVGVTGTVLAFKALNDYSVDIDVADTQAVGVILAYKRNGEYMPVREKGPLFVVFPFSEMSANDLQKRYGQSVWQVAKITVK